MNTSNLLDQLLKAGQQAMQKPAAKSPQVQQAGGLGGLLSGAGLGSLLSGAVAVRWRPVPSVCCWATRRRARWAARR